jgi:ParB family chromosome partitioning protein
MNYQRIPLSQIDTSNRLRAINPDVAQAMADGLKEGQTLPPIDVVARGDKFLLVVGGHRVEAHRLAGISDIEACLLPPEEYATDAAIRLREARENLVRYALTALDRAVHLVAWKEAHEAIHGPAKPGRKAAADELPQSSAAMFAGTFSAAAAAALDVSERTIQAAVQVATKIGREVRARISLLPIADKMSELIALSQQSTERQSLIVDLLTDEDNEWVNSVAEAVAILDKVPPPKQIESWAKLSSGFARLKQAEKNRFFAAHQSEFEVWLSRKAKA